MLGMEDLAVLHRLMLDLLLLRDTEGDLLPLLLLRRHQDTVVVPLMLLPLLRDMVAERPMLDRVDMELLRLNRRHDMEVDYLLDRLGAQVVMEHLWEDVMEVRQRQMVPNKIVLVRVNGRLDVAT